MRPFLIATLLLLTPVVAAAHSLGLSLLEAAVEDRAVEVALSFHADELGFFDADADGLLSDVELEAASTRVTAATWDRLGVGVGAGTCAPKRPTVAVDSTGGIRIVGRFVCPEPPGRLELALGYLDALAPGHRTIGEVRFGKRQESFTADRSRQRVVVHGEGGGGFTRFFLLGVEHIFTGFDHLLFLAALLLVAAGSGEIVRLVTAFTVAHSLTLAAAVLGWIELPGEWVEPLIAASIVVVAAENLLRRRLRGRPGLTFAFGLVHGFGFAGLLRELGLGAGNLLTSLAGFNLGVEAGQLAVVLAVAPPLLLARKQPWYARTAVPGLSVGIGFLGAYWFFERIFG